MSVYPNWRAGMKVRASDLTQQQIQLFRATANQVVNNTTVLANDTELVVPLLATASYIVELVCAFDNVNAGVGYRTAWTVPAGATGKRMVFGATQTAGAFTSAVNTKGKVPAVAFTTASTHQSGTIDQSHYEWLTITTGVTAGNAQFQFAQQTANASNTTRLSNSYIRVHRVA